MKKALIIVSIVFVIILASYYYIHSVPQGCIQVITGAKNLSTGETKYFPTPCDVPKGWVQLPFASTTPQDSVTSKGVTNNDIRDEAWSVIEKYLAYLKAGDVHGVETLSYNQDAIKNSIEKCAKLYSTSTDACSASLLNVSYINLSKYLLRENFKTVWYDDKQVILLSDIRHGSMRDEKGNLKGGNVEKLFIARDKDNKLKIVAINFFSANSIDELKDTDMDGKDDSTELCANYLPEQHCVKTGPNNRDSNNNGWWDGTEYEMNKLY